MYLWHLEDRVQQYQCPPRMLNIYLWLIFWWFIVYKLQLIVNQFRGSLYSFAIDRTNHTSNSFFIFAYFKKCKTLSRPGRGQYQAYTLHSISIFSGSYCSVFIFFEFQIKNSFSIVRRSRGNFAVLFWNQTFKKAYTNYCIQFRVWRSALEVYNVAHWGSLLRIHKPEPDIYIGFSPAIHLQCRLFDVMCAQSIPVSPMSHKDTYTTTITPPPPNSCSKW